MIHFLQIAGIVIASIILVLIILILVFFYVPFRYKIDVSNMEYLTGGMTVSFFLSFFRMRIYYKDKNGFLRLRLFGIKILDKSIPELIELGKKIKSWIDTIKKDKNKNAENPEDNEISGESGDSENIENAETSEEPSIEEIEEFLNEDDEIEGMNSIRKNREFFKTIKDLVLNIKKKWYNFIEFIDKKVKQWNKFKKELKFYWKVIHCPSFKPTLVLLKNVTVKVIKHTFPRKLHVKLIYGDDDAYITAKVLSYCYMIMGMFGNNFDVTPSWNEPVFKIEGYIKGRVRMSVMFNVLWQLFTSKHLRRMIKFFVKGGNVRGRK